MDYISCHSNYNILIRVVYFVRRASDSLSGGALDQGMFLYLISRSPVHPCLYQEIRPKVVEINIEDIVVFIYFLV